MPDRELHQDDPSVLNSASIVIHTGRIFLVRLLRIAPLEARRDVSLNPPGLVSREGGRACLAHFGVDEGLQSTHMMRIRYGLCMLDLIHEELHHTRTEPSSA